jgi:hypothetical protein
VFIPFHILIKALTRLSQLNEQLYRSYLFLEKEGLDEQQ